MKTLVKAFGTLLIIAVINGTALGATDQPATPAPGHSTSVPLAPDAPSSYIVKRGDTLWAIAGKFLSQPWYWPEIWYLNPEIKNPHLIYPGDTLHLVYDVNGRPHLEVERGDLGRAADAKLSPQMRTTPLDEAIKAIPYEIVAAFMSKPGVLSADDVKHGAYVAGLGERRVIAGVGDILYARGLAGVEPGTRYQIMHIGEKITDPDDRTVLGYQGIYAGSARVERAAEGKKGLAKLMINESAREAFIGDLLIPETVDISTDFVPRAPAREVKGQIISMINGVNVIGQYQVVIINRGKRHGLEAGNILTVWQTGDTVKDYGRGGLPARGELTRPFAPSRNLPSEAAGTFMVFKTYDRLSYGLILRAQSDMHVGDSVKNP